MPTTSIIHWLCVKTWGGILRHKCASSVKVVQKNYAELMDGAWKKSEV